jgi:flagellin-like protein
MKRLFRNKKAVSPVIATVLMILVTMAGMTILFGFVISYSDSYKAGIGSSVMESLTIEDIWIQSTNTVNVTVYNVGTKTNLGTDSGMDITIATIYVNGTALTNPVSTTIDFKNYVVNAGSHLTIKGSGFFNVGNTYDFKIVTTRGSNFEAQAKYSY